MKKNRAFALLFSFILIIGSVLAAEYTGTLGPDQNTSAGLSGQVNIDANTLYPNGHTCSNDSECNSGHCAADYDGTGNWCAPASYCAHDGTVTYANASTTCYGSSKEKCTSGAWVSTSCTYGCLNGACKSGGGGTSSTPAPQIGTTGGAGGTGGPSGTPTPTPSATPTPTPEKVLEETAGYAPSEEEIGNNLVEAGISEPGKIEKTIETMGDLNIEKRVAVEKTTDANGKESFKSTLTISITNTGEDTLENGTAYEFIPKSVVGSPDVITSDQPFTVVKETDDYIIISWDYGSLKPGESASFTYTADIQMDAGILKNSKSLFSATKKVAPGKKELGSIVVTVLYKGRVQAGIVVSLFKNGEKIAEATTSAEGKAEFASLETGTYYIITRATEEFASARVEDIEVTPGVIKTPKIELQPKTAPAPGPKPVDYTWLWLVVLALIVVGAYWFLAGKKKPLGETRAEKPTGLAQAVKKIEEEEAKRPFKKYKEKREKKPKREHEKKHHRPTHHKKKEEKPKEKEPQEKPVEREKPEPAEKEAGKKPLFGRAEEKPKRSFKKFREAREKGE